MTPPLSRDELLHIANAAITDEYQRWRENPQGHQPAGYAAPIVDALIELGALAGANGGQG